ncbi:type-F conjugative transfer system protein TraW [Legionella drozanskii]|uniref:Type-F conjugative transfer system protein n=1 Tax=Legionella drozanskii LLAP-1 TaxID=1212489 RepID=A0A0W0SM59_9GAMM|nr:type-F conjugative transfer system protein TraW [Legionella drozanskii]KTC84396.1 Type-F conjugative transfer system protein [Legionella drozanskii LLAP-1]
MKQLFIVFLLVATQSLFAKELGTLGQTFPVMEKSLLTLIYERLTAFQDDGKLKDLENAWVKQVEAKALRPRPLNLSRTDKTTSHYHTPVTTLKQDIQDNQGRIILKKGLTVNALTQLPMYQPVWVFIDYDDEAQRQFADIIRTQYVDIQWILTGGNVRDAELRIKETIYFDQEGRITEKLAIKHVPALVTRAEDSLKIVEFAIGENGHAF